MSTAYLAYGYDLGGGDLPSGYRFDDIVGGILDSDDMTPEYAMQRRILASIGFVFTIEDVPAGDMGALEDFTMAQDAAWRDAGVKLLTYGTPERMGLILCADFFQVPSSGAYAVGSPPVAAPEVTRWDAALERALTVLGIGTHDPHAHWILTSWED